MAIFGKPNIDKLVSKGDVKGLEKARWKYRNDHSQSLRVIEGLGRVGNPEAVPLLVGVLGWVPMGSPFNPGYATEVERNNELREAAAEALGRIGDPGALGALEDALAGLPPDRGVVSEAIFGDGSDALRRAITYALEEIRSR